MKTISNVLKYGFLIGTIALFTACGEDEPTPVEPTNVSLSGTDLETTGEGQYKLQVETGSEVALAVNLESGTELESLVITKTVNNQVDTEFGTNGVLTVDATGNDFDYTFNYTPVVEDVDQLVGFTFEGANTGGKSEEAVLNLVVTLSPIDNLTRRRWNLTSVYHVNEEEEAIKECEKDNYMLLNDDGTIEVFYGEDTGTGDCQFDGFNVYTNWEIVEEDGVQYFIRTSHNAFDPEAQKVETFTINSLTTEEIKLEQTVDLSDFGGGAEETFIYTYEAAPR